MAIVGVDSEGIDMSGVSSGGSGIDIVESGQLGRPQSSDLLYAKLHF